MRYIQPQITGTFNAVSTIQGDKIGDPGEVATDRPTDGAAYQADE
jgi:hypothetical protein